VIAVAVFLMTVGFPVVADDFNSDEDIPTDQDPPDDSTIEPIRPVAVVSLNPIKVTNVYLISDHVGGTMPTATLSITPYNKTVSAIYEWQQWHPVRGYVPPEPPPQPPSQYVDVSYRISVEIRSNFQSDQYLYGPLADVTRVFHAYWNSSVVTAALPDNGVRFAEHDWGTTGRAYIWEYGQYKYIEILWAKLPTTDWFNAGSRSTNFEVETGQTGS
jgi:hypothetical protein